MPRQALAYVDGIASDKEKSFVTSTSSLVIKLFSITNKKVKKARAFVLGKPVYWLNTRLNVKDCTRLTHQLIVV
jgi:hypothetical protein